MTCAVALATAVALSEAVGKILYIYSVILGYILLQEDYKSIRHLVLVLNFAVKLDVFRSLQCSGVCDAHNYVYSENKLPWPMLERLVPHPPTLRKYARQRLRRSQTRVIGNSIGVVNQAAGILSICAIPFGCGCRPYPEVSATICSPNRYNSLA